MKPVLPARDLPIASSSSMKMMHGPCPWPARTGRGRRRADADEHLDELRAGEGEEGHVRLARDGPGEERLARARRAHQQDALGEPTAEPLVLLGILEEVDDLDELRLRLVDAGDVAERRP